MLDRCRCWKIVGDGELPSFFEVTSLAATSMGLAGAMLSRIAAGGSRDPDPVIVDRRLASLWFGLSLHPNGWQLAPIWDAVAGDYRTSDGWIRLHTNAPHHRARALAVLGVGESRDAVAKAVGQWNAETLETAIVAAGGCAAMMRDFAVLVGASARTGCCRANRWSIWDEGELGDTEALASTKANAR